MLRVEHTWGTHTRRELLHKLWSPTLRKMQLGSHPATFKPRRQNQITSSSNLYNKSWKYTRERLFATK